MSYTVFRDGWISVNRMLPPPSIQVNVLIVFDNPELTTVCPVVGLLAEYTSEDRVQYVWNISPYKLVGGRITHWARIPDFPEILDAP